MFIKTKLESIHWFFLAFIILLLPLFFGAIFIIDTIVHGTVKQLFFVLFGVSFFLLLLSFIRPKIFLLSMSPVMVLGFIEIYNILTLKTYTSLGIFSAILKTNHSEATEFAEMNYWYFVISILLIASYLFFSINVKFDFRFSKWLRVLFIGFFLLLQSSFITRDAFIFSRSSDSIFDFYYLRYAYNVKISKTYPVNWIYNIRLYNRNNRRLNQYEENIEGFYFGAKSERELNEPKTIVLVIGETARRHNFSLYGYHRETNPLLSKVDDLIVLNNAEANYSITTDAYANFFSRATTESLKVTYEEPSFLQALKESGFHTIYINNQPLGYGSIFHLYANQADSLIDLSTSFDVYSTDEIIIPVFQEIINNQTHERLFIVVHSMGSHFRYNLRYPESFNKFLPVIDSNFPLTSVTKSRKEELINSYDNSILFTDFFLTELITSLKSDTSKISLLLYASDHGENLFDDERGIFGHGRVELTKYEREIPLMLWPSTKYSSNFENKIREVKNNKNSLITTDHLFHSILDLSGIYIDKETKLNSFASDKFVNKDKNITQFP